LNARTWATCAAVGSAAAGSTMIEPATRTSFG
jgi:hypothetical protein